MSVAFYLYLANEIPRISKTFLANKEILYYIILTDINNFLEMSLVTSMAGELKRSHIEQEKLQMEEVDY